MHIFPVMKELPVPDAYFVLRLKGKLQGRLFAAKHRTQCVPYRGRLGLAAVGNPRFLNRPAHPFPKAEHALRCFQHERLNPVFKLRHGHGVQKYMVHAQAQFPLPVKSNIQGAAFPEQGFWLFFTGNVRCDPGPAVAPGVHQKDDVIIMAFKQNILTFGRPVRGYFFPGRTGAGLFLHHKVRRFTAAGGDAVHQGKFHAVRPCEARPRRKGIKPVNAPPFTDTPAHFPVEFVFFRESAACGGLVRKTA